MKVSRSISIDELLLMAFMEYCEQNRLDRNQVISNLIADVIKVVFIKCDKCGSSYSNKLNDCPQCKLNQKPIDEDLIKQQRVEYQQHLIERYQLALKDEVCDAERIAHLNERIKDCLAKIELIKTLKNENPV